MLQTTWQSLQWQRCWNWLFALVHNEIKWDVLIALSLAHMFDLKERFIKRRKECITISIEAYTCQVDSCTIGQLHSLLVHLLSSNTKDFTNILASLKSRQSFRKR